jgi:hypothetical protein
MNPCPFLFGVIMTKNTKLYKTKFKENNKQVELYFRDLTILELEFFKNIKNLTIRYEMAGKTSVYNMDPNKVPFPTLLIIGEQAINNSTKEIDDITLLEIFINEKREEIKQNYLFIGIKNVLEAFPGQSITDLMKLTPRDLFELICLAETIVKRPLFKFGNFKKQGMSLIDSSKLADDGKSLQEKMNELKSFL